MCLPERLIRGAAGWLVIPASLLALLSGCQTTNNAQVRESAVVSRSTIEAQPEGSPFKQIFTDEADVFVLTFFDLYCVACQQSANNFQALPGELEVALPDTLIRVTGVAVGDTSFELEVFRRKYQLDYNCLPDPDKSFEKPFVLRGTPTVLAFIRNGPNCQEIYRHEGRFRLDDMAKLVQTLKLATASTLSP